MKPGSIVHTIAVLLSSVTSLFSQSTATQVPAAKMKLSKKSSTGAGGVVRNDPIAYTKSDPPKQQIERFPWLDPSAFHTAAKSFLLRAAV